MANNLTPARAVPPGRILRRELDARGWTQKDLAEMLGRPSQAITEIVRGDKQITPETAIALGSAFETTAEFWTNLEANYRLALAHAKPSSVSEVSRKAALFSWAPIAELRKRGWIGATSSVGALERALCAFFGVKNVGDEPPLSVNLRHSLKDGAERSSQRAWVKRVESLVAKQSVSGVFDSKQLHQYIPELKKAAATVEGVSRVPLMLNSQGIRFVVVPPLPGTKLDGAAGFEQGSPFVALSMRHDRVDYFWFTLLHELAHLVLEHRGGHLDTETDGGLVDAEEDAANQLAAGWLLSDDDARAFASKHGCRPSSRAVDVFSSQHGLHPGIVVGRLHHLELVPYTHFRGTLAKVKERLVTWTDGPDTCHGSCD